MSQKLEEGLKTFSDSSKRNDKKAQTFKGALPVENKLKNMKQRKSMSYSTHGELLEYIIKQSAGSQTPSVKTTLTRRGSTRRTWKKSSKNNSKILNSSIEGGSGAKENEKDETPVEKKSNVLEVPQAGDDGWETISENEKKNE